MRPEERKTKTEPSAFIRYLSVCFGVLPNFRSLLRSAYLTPRCISMLDTNIVKFHQFTIYDSGSITSIIVEFLKSNLSGCFELD